MRPTGHGPQRPTHPRPGRGHQDAACRWRTRRKDRARVRRLEEHDIVDSKRETVEGCGGTGRMSEGDRLSLMMQQERGAHPLTHPGMEREEVRDRIFQ